MSDKPRPSLEITPSVDGCGYDLKILFGNRIESAQGTRHDREMRIYVRFLEPFPYICEVTLDGVSQDNFTYDEKTAQLTHRNQLQ